MSSSVHCQDSTLGRELLLWVPQCRTTSQAVAAAAVAAPHAASQDVSRWEHEAADAAAGRSSKKGVSPKLASAVEAAALQVGRGVCCWVCGRRLVCACVDAGMSG